MKIRNRFSNTLRDGSHVRITLADIDANDAQDLLLTNTDNRKLRKAKVDEYRRAIEQGDFPFNGDAIRISKDRVLLDGQHRLVALSETTETITTLLVEGIASAVRETIDVGAPRTAANLIEFGGDDRILNSVNIAALGRAALIMSDEPMPGKPEVARFVHENQEDLMIAYRHGVQAVDGGALKGGTTPYALAAWLIGKVEKDDDVIGYFFSKLASGEGLFHGDPILTLRNRLISRPPRTEGGSKHRYQHNSVLFIRAWNAWANGIEMTQVRSWGEGQQFPAVKPATAEVRDMVHATQLDSLAHQS